MRINVSEERKGINGRKKDFLVDWSVYISILVCVEQKMVEGRLRMGRNNGTKEKLMEVAFELMWGHSYGSVSVDQICERAAVKKGSFYYFFPSKTELVMAAYEAHWGRCRSEYDTIFSPQVPPLERIKRYCSRLYEHQKDCFVQNGRVLGCPFAAIGSELSTQDEKMREKSEEMLERMIKYWESTLRDAEKEGLWNGGNAREAAESICAYVIGTLLQAKIRNDAETIKPLYTNVLRLAGMPMTPAQV